MATVNEDILTIYDDINAHERKHTDSNLEPDIKKEENESTEVTEHTKKNSSLLDIDYIPQTSLSADEDRKASQSTESVQVYIYRRTSLVTSSGSASVMKIDDSEMTGSTHRSTETGMNLWDNTTTTIENYQLQHLQEVNTWKKDKTYEYDENDTNPKQNTKSDTLVSEMEENKQIESIINLPQIKARRSISVTDEKYNDTAITRKLSATSALNQDHEPHTNDNNENVSNRPIRSTSVIYYGEVGGNNTDSQINESMSNKNGVNDSAMLQLIPSNHNRSKAQMHGSLSLQLDENELNEEFYKDIKNKRVAHKTKSKSMQFSNLPKIRKSEIETNVDMERKYNVNVEDFDVKEEVVSPQMLTAQNLMVHDYAHSLNEMDEIENEMEHNKKDNNRLRYIAMTDNIQQQQQASMSFLIQKKEKKKNNMKLSTRIKYITAVGAICAVSILVGVVLYSRNNNEPQTHNRLMTPPRRRRLPPR